MQSTGYNSNVVELTTQKDDDYTAWAKQVGAPYAGAALEFANMERWDEQPPPVQGWAVIGHIPLGSVTGLYGEGAVGKSTAAVQLAVACAGGRIGLACP
ncbi:AAA family ATPase [Bradyrhizobium sp. Arg68]|nr:AAA family ATPase [Bradyrhizobium ivorense]